VQHEEARAVALRQISSSSVIDGLIDEAAEARVERELAKLKARLL
jgi:hypothetical protein